MITVMDAATDLKHTVCFSNAQKVSYRAEPEQDQVHNAGSRIQNAVKGSYFGLQVEGRLGIIPLSGVQRVEIDPAPGAQVSHVMPSTQQLDDAALGG